MRRKITLCSIIAVNTIISMSVWDVVTAAPRATPSAEINIMRLTFMQNPENCMVTFEMCFHPFNNQMNGNHKFLLFQNNSLLQTFCGLRHNLLSPSPNQKFAIGCISFICESCNKIIFSCCSKNVLLNEEILLQIKVIAVDCGYSPYIIDSHL